MYEFNWKQVVCTKRDTHQPILPHYINKSWIKQTRGFCWLGCRSTDYRTHALGLGKWLIFCDQSTTNALTFTKSKISLEMARKEQKMLRLSTIQIFCKSWIASASKWPQFWNLSILNAWKNIFGIVWLYEISKMRELCLLDNISLV